MPFPKLSPLQSRLAASLIATAILSIIYFIVSNPHFADAADVGSFSGDQHHYAGYEGLLAEDGTSDLEFHHADSYEPEFPGLDRGIIGRAPDGVNTLSNNEPGNLSIGLGSTSNW